MVTQGATPPNSPTGTRFGKYQLIKKLASGGMGEVFLAKQVGPVGFEKILVIKRILAKHLDKQAYVDMFFSEARVAALLTHSNIVQIYDMGEEQEHFFIAMEYVNGRSLREIIDGAMKAGRPVPLPYILDITAQVCAGMSYAHNMVDTNGQPLNLVHRDINPQNLLISYHGEAKVIDFGIAKSSVNTHKTEAGTIKGKYVYMSPEQSAAEPLDKRSDLFALGIVMYEMCTGVNPFHQNTIVASLEAIQRKEPPPLEGKRPDCAIFAPIVAKTLAKERDERYSDAADIRQDILDLQQSGQVERMSEPLSAYLNSMFASNGETSTPGARSPSSTSGSGQARARSASNAAGKALKPGTSGGTSSPVRGKTPPPAPSPTRTGSGPGKGITPPPARTPAPARTPTKPPLPSAGGQFHQQVPVKGAASELFPDADPTELEQDPQARMALAKVSTRKKSKVNPTVVYALLGVLAALVVMLAVGIAARLLGYWPRPAGDAPVAAAAQAPDPPAAEPAPGPAAVPAPTPAPAVEVPAPAEDKGLGTLTLSADGEAKITVGPTVSTGEASWTVKEPAGEVRVQGPNSFDVRMRYALKDGRVQLNIQSEPAAAMLVDGNALGSTPLGYSASSGAAVKMVFKSSNAGSTLSVTLKFQAP